MSNKRRAIVSSELRYKDINFDPTIITNPSGAPDVITWRGSGNYVAVAFDGGSSVEQVQGIKELQHDYKEGSDLKIHIHWAPSTVGAGNVRWQCEYEVIRTGQVAAITSGTVNVVTSADGTAWEQKAVNIGTITGTDLKIGDQIALRLFRDPNDGSDTYADDAVIAFTYGIHYQVDDLGSQQEFIK